MSLPNRPPQREVDARGFALVVLSYRCAMAEICGAHAKYCAGVWEALETVAPGDEAEDLYRCFFAFVRALLAVAERPLEWRQAYCAHLCRDEWLAVSMIDAAQRADVAELLQAASELIGVEALGDALNAAQALASALSRRGLYLCPRSGGDRCPMRTLH